MADHLARQDVPERADDFSNRLNMPEDPTDADAQFILGKKDVVERDYKSSARWFCLAAVQGHLGGQYQLARHYEFGDGVPQGNEKAAFWYRLAADQGYADAQFKLGSVYAQGRLGIKKDEQESAIWYLKAAEQGHYESQREIGLRFHHGLGIEQSHIDAFYWFAIYLSRGYYIDAYIAQFRDASGAWLTLAELFAVKRRADLWFAGHPPPADAAEKSRYCREEFFKWAASHHEDDDFDPVEWMRERRREQGFSSPDEEQNAYLIQLARMHVNKVEGEVRVMRFFAPHNPEFRARAWAIRNKDHLRAYEGWRTPSGDVVALYVPERGWDAPE